MQNTSDRLICASDEAFDQQVELVDGIEFFGSPEEAHEHARKMRPDLYGKDTIDKPADTEITADPSEAEVTDSISERARTNQKLHENTYAIANVIADNSCVPNTSSAASQVPSDIPALPSEGAAFSNYIAQHSSPGFAAPFKQPLATGTVNSDPLRRPNCYALAQQVANRLSLFSADHALFVYDGRCYQRLSQRAAETKILDACRAEVAGSGSHQTITGIYRFLVGDSTFQDEDAPKNKRFLAFMNGVLDLWDGQLHGYSPAFRTVHALNCSYFSQPLPCPCFEQFLLDCSGGDPDWIARAWEMLGYALVPDTAGKAAMLFQGVGDSGKSVLCEFIQNFFPPSQVSALSIHDLSQQFAASELEGKSLCISPDMPRGALKPAAVSNLKRLTGNDTISAPKKFQDNRQFRFDGTIILASNHGVYCRGDDDAFLQRLVTLPFIYTIPKERQDPALLGKLLNEMDAVASRAIVAYFSLRANHYRFSGSFRPNEFVNDEYGLRDSIPPGAVLEFLRTRVVADPSGVVFVSDAYEQFVKQYPFAQYLPFSKEFQGLVHPMFGTRRGRMRKPGEPNAASCIHGIKLI